MSATMARLPGSTPYAKKRSGVPGGGGEVGDGGGGGSGGSGGGEYGGCDGGGGGGDQGGGEEPEPYSVLSKISMNFSRAAIEFPVARSELAAAAGPTS
jgi:hypothetical protein